MSLRQNRLRRNSWCAAAGVCALVVASRTCWDTSGAAAVQRAPGARDAAESSAGSGEQQIMRVREGAVLDTTGYFKVSGDRALFTTADGTGRFTGLENLNLERVAIAVTESPDQLLWTVTGTVTEYRGTNYLLVTRALLKTKATPTKNAPERAAPKGK